MSSVTTSSSPALDSAQPQEKPGQSPQVQNIPNRRALKKAQLRQPGEKAASAFRTISEVATELKVEQHVLRFWESKFTQIKPLKRGGGRRYYRPEDIELLKNIHTLLYSEGYTIKGVQKLLQATRGNLTGRMSSALDDDASAAQKKAELKTMLDDLKSMRKLID